MSGDAPAVEIARLEHRYAPAARGAEGRLALGGVSFTVGAGEIFGLLGPNGGGKTTLFRILSTSMRPTGGRARVFGHDVVTQRDEVRRRIGVVFQSPSLDKKLTARENLRHQGHLYGMRGEALERRIEEMLARMGILDRADDRVETLSGGQRRRVEVAKGMLHGPRLLLLDEPSTGLDPAARRDLVRELASLRAREGVTIVLTTHIMEEAEACGRLAILDRGRVVAEGTPAALRERVGGDVIAIGAAVDPDGLARAIRERFGADATVLEGTVRLERPRGHEFVAALFDAFPGRIASVQIGRPTLEDVFIRETGRRFTEAMERPAPAAAGAHGRVREAARG